MCWASLRPCTGRPVLPALVVSSALRSPPEAFPPLLFIGRLVRPVWNFKNPTYLVSNRSMPLLGREAFGDKANRGIVSQQSPVVGHICQTPDRYVSGLVEHDGASRAPSAQASPLVGNAYLPISGGRRLNDPHGIPRTPATAPRASCRGPSISHTPLTRGPGSRLAH